MLYIQCEDNDDNDNMLIYQSIWLVAMYVFFEEKKIDCRKWSHKKMYNLVFVFIRIILQNVL